MNKKILTETKRAYGDCQQACQTRNLNFRASKPVSVPDAVLIMTEALCLTSPNQEGYNEFRPSQLEMLPVGSMVTLAREGSVCVYVKLPAGEVINYRMQENMMVDECQVQPDGTVRLWWD